MVPVVGRAVNVAQAGVSVAARGTKVSFSIS